MVTDVPADTAATSQTLDAPQALREATLGKRARRTWEELEAEARAVAERSKESWAALEAEARAAEGRAQEGWASIEAANASAAARASESP
jgi:hypothetical protein